MKTARSTWCWFQRAKVAGCAALLMLEARADATTTTATTPSATPAEGQSLLAAKRDLEAIHALKEMQLRGIPNAAGPRVAIPELRTDSPAAPQSPAPPARRVVNPESKSNNWLVDAMERREREDRKISEATRGSQRRSDEKEERSPEDSPELQRGTSFLSPARSERQSQDRDSNRSPNPDDVLGARDNNPLSRYLGEWMTPQDYAMMRPGLDGVFFGGSVSEGRSPGQGISGLPVDSFAIKRDIPGGFTPSPGAAIDSSPRENPFLASLDSATRAAPPRMIVPPVTPGPAGVASSAAPQRRPAVTQPEIVPARPRVPEFAKPGQDEKFFKPLKRF